MRTFLLICFIALIVAVGMGFMLGVLSINKSSRWSIHRHAHRQHEHDQVQSHGSECKRANSRKSGRYQRQSHRRPTGKE